MTDIKEFLLAILALFFVMSACVEVFRTGVLAVNANDYFQNCILLYLIIKLK